ncbi:ligase-associated DNA damage response DEXH box helicase [Glaciecola petra]|uniref:Ligase-associated DNA damage response DEXH box helicase n=1 Tax=Glaciecola petra TaxID=3075602 RepID=A0ABU2ZVF2_9ALTE|nr:ligase-associated DNA damage response DEXH box helicase [Aestuariibacter sp. P117]MDT0596216.1 ligase-associated DNA damage response DEXH box helicase [Aestuariibacter sp. P117]
MTAVKRGIIPSAFKEWFSAKHWKVRPYQQKMVSAFANQESTLLIAPTGAGKTLSGFLPSLIDIDKGLSSGKRQQEIGLHTLYVSPLKALTYDINRNLSAPIEQMGLAITVDARTGDTTAYRRQKQRKSPPNILLTTPESLMLMLSYADAAKIFANLKCVIVDEAHSFANSKRGDFMSLALARLRWLNSSFIRVGLSATVAHPESLANWLGPSGEPVNILKAKSAVKPKVSILTNRQHIPFGGYMAKYARKEILNAITKAQTSLVFVNTRAQAELIFQSLWEINSDALPIAIYHGSLSKEQRTKTEALMAEGKLRAIVATSALELGIDWGNVDLVIQVGAPKGVSRLMQRIGRSNHTLDEPSKALLVPANRFESLECLAAIKAIKAGDLDGEPPISGSLDIIPQYIMNCVCSQATTPELVYSQILDAAPYCGVDKSTFDQLWAFTYDGGYALKGYERYNRLSQNEDGFTPSNKRVIMRHRQNIGTIVEAGRLRVKKLRRAHQGKIIGEVEEYFAQQLVKGDSFYFAGEVLVFEGIRDMMVEARPGKAKEPKIPSYMGGQMPLSTYLADAVRSLINQPKAWQKLPKLVRDWLQLQQAFSHLPSQTKLLIEHFPYRKSQTTLFYTFEGRKANQTLGMLITRRMEKQGLKPLSFSITDYGLSIASINTIQADDITTLFNPDILGDELEDWMLEASMLKRSFRQVAVVSGLIEQQYHSSKKTMRQVTFSTDLIYDTLREYEPDHVLLKVTRENAQRELLDLERTATLLFRFHQNFEFISLAKPSPMSIPIVLDVRSELITGAGTQSLLEQANLYQEAVLMLDDVRLLLEGNN